MLYPSIYPEKLERVEAMYTKEQNLPEFFWEILRNERSELNQLKEKFKKDEISPFEF